MSLEVRMSNFRHYSRQSAPVNYAAECTCS